MKPNPNLDELLSSFMDGELSPRQRTEVQRMAAHDPAVARRLCQLQNCRALFCALPPAEAPSDMLEQIKQSLERKTLLQEHPASRRRAAGVMQLVFRKFVAAAAMIALVAVLGAVVYQIVSPVPDDGLSPVATPTNPPESVPENMGGPAPAILVADARFSGRLELQTAVFASTDAFLRREILTCGLENVAEAGLANDQRVYQVTGSREGITRLVASLSGVWQDFESALLEVDATEDTAGSVTIESVTPDQVAAVVAGDSYETAATYAIMNRLMHNGLNGDVSSIHENSGGLLAMDIIPMPKLTGPGKPIEATHTPAQGTTQASLTIVLLRTTK